ncbi:hypothetical protein [Burkholderia glumae]|uniref:hypothetical protein n=1 Tax=Burkholderia glumae TaxID=337 RepID=UPI00148EAB25|nr:hypothetical protein [Burkholderia glumae]QJW78727.1 hypothetical protein GAS18_08145 [Burkholderia glumae]
MNNSGSTPADWTKLYDWYWRNTEALQEQVEAITDDLPKVREEVAVARKNAQSMTQMVETIRSQVKQAQEAWDKAEDIANTVGLTAASSATAAVATATDGMVSSLGQATKDATDVTAALKRTVTLSRATSIAYLLLLVTVCATCSYLAYRRGVSDEMARHTEPSAERSATLMYQGAMLEKMFQQGTANDRKKLEQLYKRAVGAPL